MTIYVNGQECETDTKNHTDGSGSCVSINLTEHFYVLCI